MFKNAHPAACQESEPSRVSLLHGVLPCGRAAASAFTAGQQMALRASLGWGWRRSNSS